jgi:hypothetical protein
MARPRPGSKRTITCPTCKERVLAVFHNDHWGFPKHNDGDGKPCPTTSKLP